MTSADPPDRRPVRVVPYDPAWPALAREAARAIVEACGGLVLRVEHVGSTAVPGLAAKPVLDLMPALARTEDGERIGPMMTALGYAVRGELGILGRHLFTRRIDGDTHVEQHNVHAYETSHPEWERHLVFRDALRADGVMRAEYERVKRALAEQYRDDLATYAESKSPFIDEVIAAHGGPPRRR
jgi:GrpB-like predicted nucleotidyltransferase (UPF0157 family)